MTASIDPRTRLEVLDRQECLALIARESLGRLAVVSDDGRPYVFPVNFALDGGSVVFRTDLGTKVHLAEGRWVAFECDGVDRVYHTGWSVLVSGIAEVVTNDSEVAHLEKLPLGVWSPGTKSTWVRIRAMGLSGRRIPPHGSNDGLC